MWETKRKGGRNGADEKGNPVRQAGFGEKGIPNHALELEKVRERNQLWWSGAKVFQSSRRRQTELGEKGSQSSMVSKRISSSGV